MHVRRAALVALLALVLGACGASDDDPAAVPSAPSPADAPAAGAPGVAIDGSGVPDLPDASPAAPCDGASVLCVDATAGTDAADGTAEAPFASIGDAVAAAGPGATVQVAAGTYVEAVVLEGARDLTLLGGFPAGGDFATRDAGGNATVVQGGPGASVVRVTGSEGVRVEGLHLTGGGGWDDGGGPAGGGVLVDATSRDVAVVGNLIESNAAEGSDDPGATLGGGVASFGTDVLISGNVLAGNRSGRGAGVASQGSVTVTGNVVRDNTAVGDHGGGLYLFGEVTATDNLVEGNEVGRDLGYGWGGGILVYGDDTTAELRGNVVTDNGAPSAGSGVFVDDGADARLVGELYHRNRCPVDGGAGLFADSGGTTATVVEVENATIAAHECGEVATGGTAVLAVVSDEGGGPVEVTIVSSVLWDGGPSDVASAGASVAIRYSIVGSGAEADGVTAEEVLAEDPLLADPEEGDLGLRPGSPAIDGGDPAADVGAEPEPNGGRIDMGHTGGTAAATMSS